MIGSVGKLVKGVDGDEKIPLDEENSRCSYNQEGAGLDLNMATYNKNTFLQELRWRGFIEATTSNDLDTHLSEAQRTIYAGFDPTADSLHLGSLTPVMALAHAQRNGHRPLAMVGGGTGLIGDPRGETFEQKFLRMKVAENDTVTILWTLG